MTGTLSFLLQVKKQLFNVIRIEGWFSALPPGRFVPALSIVKVDPLTKGGYVFRIEKDDPREAPESGDKKPQPVKK
ncbi:hypothetical protein [Enterobacter sp. Bisph1]|uniref:hypothetical protein n=1 Tax=Enterobacter sp. Bisph1 TaxID=1274399 RepID=UPI00057BDCC8|nr:hypothetical protein [Enterobacter sp. Bisph1]